MKKFKKGDFVRLVNGTTYIIVLVTRKTYKKVYKKKRWANDSQVEYYFSGVIVRTNDYEERMATYNKAWRMSVFHKINVEMIVKV